MKESIQDAMPSISPAEIRRARIVFVIACAARLRAEANHCQHFWATLLEQQAVSRLPLEVPSCNVTHHIFHAYASNSASSVVIGHSLMEFYLDNKIPFQMNLGFH